MSYQAGVRYAKGLKILCLDSDPASMLEQSGLRGAWKGKLVRTRYERWAAQADATIFVGSGVSESYGRFARRSITTNAVWLQKGELADEAATAAKYEDPQETVRMAIPSRLTAWKGVDDVILALPEIAGQLGPVQLDVIGEGPEKPRLVSLAKESKHMIRFLPSVPYGQPFFTLLRSYHVILAPTRALEEARIVYDAAASGCVLIHSATKTLGSALQGITRRWTFQPASQQSIQSAILAAFRARSQWGAAALEGIAYMKERTIDEMHAIRSRFVNNIVASI